MKDPSYLSFSQVMEALTSGRALDEAINEGSYLSYKSLPKSSLPHSKKKHIYEGIDISAITRDILKIPCSAFTNMNSGPYSVGRKLLTNQPPTASRSIKCSNIQQEFKENAKYRHFIENRNNADNFGRLPNLSPRCSDIPTNYNNFFSSEFERRRLQTTSRNGLDICRKNGASPTVIQCSEALKESETPETYPTIERLMVHIEDVKRMMGRKNGALNSKKVQKRNISRKALSEPLDPATRPTSVTLSHCKSVGFSRHKSVLDHYPELAAGRDVLGFSRNWPRSGIKHSVVPIEVAGIQRSSTLPLIDFCRPR